MFFLGVQRVAHIYAATMKDPDKRKSEKRNRNYVYSSSATDESEAFPTAVAGVIESDRSTICGGLVVLCCGSHRDSHCAFRSSSKRNVVVVVNSKHCKWCTGASSKPVEENDLIRVRTIAYLRGIFQLKLGDATRLSELISELTRTQTNCDAHGVCSFTGTPPYCTVENVTHISSSALEKLIEFDKEFVWGDNLIFNTKAEGPDDSRLL